MITKRNNKLYVVEILEVWKNETPKKLKSCIVWHEYSMKKNALSQIMFF